MDKKNTLLLTVIAVATLLVAVVGATFAYFSLSVTNNATQTKATVTAGQAGLVTISGGITNLVLNVTAEDMAKPQDAAKNYYAIVDGTLTDSEAGGKWALESSADKITHKIATATLSNADENDTYTCGYTITVTPSGFDELSWDEFEEETEEEAANDIVLTITHAGISEGKKELKFSDLKTGSIAPITGSFTLGSTNGTSSDITAQLYLVNDNTRTQNYLAGKTLSVSIDVKGTTCTVSSATD